MTTSKHLINRDEALLLQSSLSDYSERLNKEYRRQMRAGYISGSIQTKREKVKRSIAAVNGFLKEIK